MRRFLFEAALAFFVVLAVVAVVFRSGWARDMLRFGRNLAWVYIVVVVLLAIVRVWQGGF